MEATSIASVTARCSLSERECGEPPRDRDGAVAVLREAVALGINHIDTSDLRSAYYESDYREALHPYPDGLTIVTKVGYRRPADKSWQPALSRDDLTTAIHDNLTNLGLEVLDVVNLRVGGPQGPKEGSIAEPLEVLVDSQRQGLIRHLGLSNVTPAQVEEARPLAKIVCVQNYYNLAHRKDDNLIDELARQNIAYTPFFPLGVLRRSNRPHLPTRRRTYPLRRCRSRLPGCYNVRQTSCSFPAPHPPNICGKTLKPQNWSSRWIPLLT